MGGLRVQWFSSVILGLSDCEIESVIKDWCGWYWEVINDMTGCLFQMLLNKVCYLLGTLRCKPRSVKNTGVKGRRINTSVVV